MMQIQNSKPKKGLMETTYLFLLQYLSKQSNHHSYSEDEGSGSRRTVSGVLSAERTDALHARIHKLVNMWADEEQMAGNIVFYWNIMSDGQMKEVANKVPTNLDELAECNVSENFRKEYGARLVKNINACVESETLRGCFEKSPRKKRKTNASDSDDEEFLCSEESENEESVCSEKSR
ncbi:hypothetical protein ACHAXM_011372 [Skeletonema potamos]